MPHKIGANAVLLIEALFDKGYCEMSVDKMIAFAHAKGLEVLLETHTEEEFRLAVETDADLDWNQQPKPCNPKNRLEHNKRNP